MVTEMSCENQSQHQGHLGVAVSAYQHQGSDGGLQKVLSCTDVCATGFIRDKGVGANCPCM